MQVTAKFRCHTIRRSQFSRQNPQTGAYEPGEMQTIELSPVTGSPGESLENRSFWAATPSGKIELGCVNAAAAAQFDLGKEYYVSFEVADNA